ncbi:hypothetical protein YC2023_102280 [Brassica napus]
MCFQDNYLIPPEPYSFSLRLCPITAWEFGLVHLQGSTSLLESLLGYKLNAIQLDLKHHQPSPSSTPFSAVASTVPDHSSTVSAAVISTPDYMLGLRNTVFLNQPPSQITQPSLVNFTAADVNNKSSRNSNAQTTFFRQTQKCRDRSDNHFSPRDKLQGRIARENRSSGGF